MSDTKPKAYYGPGGALVTDRRIDKITWVMDDYAAKFYGGKHLVAESMSREAAVAISNALGFELVDAPFIKGES